ncbi:MAG: heme lyase CcmF/NrfE family subunit [Shewanellaceae bacterium]|nr:heme lyase CcmF/NrfE family subunit [Shewanellaceae bacterium]
MYAELGQVSLILACVSALMLSVVPSVGIYYRNVNTMAYAGIFARMACFFVALAMMMLIICFVSDEFSVAYVAANSNTQLPTFYKVAAVWGGHEGSLLLWLFCLSLWTWAVAHFSGTLEVEFLTRVLLILGWVMVGFGGFIMLTSNPFELSAVVPPQGRDLNPLLQDIGLIVHPPMLYMGYVGFAVSFAFAMAALLGGRLDAAWIRWCRPWTLVAWTFLTGGIALGSWWAYYELGWGGWWFWDPVENASLMPWLLGTALIHALIISEKRGIFRQWTVLLAVFAFAFSLLGTFIVRSGVLTSVHSFAADPKRGLFILLLLFVVMSIASLLFAWRGRHMSCPVKFTLFAKETWMLVGNLLLVVACLTVMIGTLYPLLIDALGMGKISVGPPYFNTVIVPLTLASFLLMGVVPWMRWRDHAFKVVQVVFIRRLFFCVLMAAGITWWLEPVLKPWAILGLSASFWVIWSHIIMVWRLGSTARGWQWSGLTWKRSGMLLAHIGIAVTAMGATVVTHYEQETSLYMKAGTHTQLAGYEFVFMRAQPIIAQNYQATRMTIEVKHQGSHVAWLYPERRQYEVRGMSMNEAAIDWGFWRDLYVHIGEPMAQGYAVRISYKPCVRWLWFGAVLMMLGGGSVLMAQREARRVRLAAAKYNLPPVQATS